ncbi:glycosyltransferase [Acuticoccus sp. MNP-M23]|uniref:glycosyltransferase n=1 Tax=Acuticoccus sp. MNP-M23 TaxID=3072793 RepID=UPI002814EF64|nr:glycosyltransferase [Acuticoccus sp. MNP-M23]WMS42790.1 glycosyltransferase [Acuticoccus sp. MNP-M23]
MKYAVAHLIDDASFGGINRMLAHLEATSEDGAVCHRIVRVRRGQMNLPQMQADVVVSHLSTSWSNMPLFTALRAAYPDQPLIHVEHSYSERFAALNVTSRARFGALLKSAYALFDRVVAVSEAQANWLVRRGFVAEQKLHVIHPCVDLEPFMEAASAPAPGRRIVGALGRFDTQKGFDILIKAFRALPTSDMTLHLYGDGPEREALVALAAGQPNIVFKGFAANPAEAIAECDVIAMPSRWEPFGLVALEALAASRPVICPRADGMACHLVAGAIDVQENTPGGWAACLEEVFSVPADIVDGERVASEAMASFEREWTELLQSVTPSASPVAPGAITGFAAATRQDLHAG